MIHLKTNSATEELKLKSSVLKLEKMEKIAPWCFLLVCLVLVACKSSVQTEDQLAKHVPANAVFAASISPERLMQKSDYDEVKNYELFKEQFDKLKDSIPVFAEILETPRKSGIDFSKNTYFFVLNNPDRRRQFLVTLLMPLSDVANFESLVTASSKAGVKSGDSFQYILPLKGESVVAWNKEKAMIFGVSRGRHDLKAISTIFNVTEDASLAANSNFAKGFQGDHDIKFFVSSNPIVENLPPGALLGPSMAGISQATLKDNYTFGSWDFENGEMKGTMTYDLKSELTKHYSLFFKEQQETDFCALIPSENLNRIFTYSLNLKGVHQGLVEKSVINMVNELLKDSDLKFKEVAQAFSGDFTIAGYTRNESESLDYLGITTIKNREVVDQLLEAGVKSGSLVRVNKNHYSSPERKSDDNPLFADFMKAYQQDYHFFMDGNYLYYANNSAMFRNIQTNNFKPFSSSNPEIQNVLKTGVGSFYTDFQNSPMLEFRKIKEFDYLYGSGNHDGATIIVKSFKKDENSLKTLLRAMAERYEAERKQSPL